MTDLELEEIINNVEKLITENLLYKRSISENVEIAKLWKAEPSIHDAIGCNSHSENLYLIKNKKNEYIGIVLDMGTDLHALILEKFRKQGYLYEAFKKTIFPYMKSIQKKENINITIDLNRKDAVNSALKIGFIQINEGEFQYHLKNDDDYAQNFEKPKINKEDVLRLKKKLFYGYRLLYKLNDEIIINYNIETNLGEIIEDLNDELIDFEYFVK